MMNEMTKIQDNNYNKETKELHFNKQRNKKNTEVFKILNQNLKEEFSPSVMEKVEKCASFQ